MLRLQSPNGDCDMANCLHITCAINIFAESNCNMSQVTALYHIVFATKSRHQGIDTVSEECLYKFIWDIISEKKCKLFRIGGMPDHIHMLINLNPEVALSDLMQRIKRQSSNWMKSCGLFPHFNGWGKGYYAASRSESDKPQQIDYIRFQKAHHTSKDSLTELKEMMTGDGISWEDWKDVN